jgi:hypothetical protein
MGVCFMQWLMDFSSGVLGYWSALSDGLSTCQFCLFRLMLKNDVPATFRRNRLIQDYRMEHSSRQALLCGIELT